MSLVSAARFLWQRLLGRPVAECGRLRQRTGGPPGRRPPPQRANVAYTLRPLTTSRSREQDQRGARVREMVALGGAGPGGRWSQLRRGTRNITRALTLAGSLTLTR